MNCVLEACVHCGDMDSALKVFDEMIKLDGYGVDTITYGTLLKVQVCFQSQHSSLTYTIRHAGGAVRNVFELVLVCVLGKRSVFYCYY